MSSLPVDIGPNPRTSYVKWGLLNVDASILRDMDQLMLRYELYGEAEPGLTLLKELIQRLLNDVIIPNSIKNKLNKILTRIKIIKVY